MKPKIYITIFTCVAVAMLILAGCSSAAGNTTTPTTSSTLPLTTSQAPSTTSSTPTTSFQPTTSVTPTTSTTKPPTTSSSIPPTTSTFVPPTSTTTPPPPTTSIAPTTSVVPTTSETLVPTSTPPATTAKPLGGEAPIMKSHPADGAFAACFTCHLDTVKPAPVLPQDQIGIRHACDQCHARTPMPEIFSHEESLVSLPEQLETVCVICHLPTPEK